MPIKRHKRRTQGKGVMQGFPTLFEAIPKRHRVMSLRSNKLGMNWAFLQHIFLPYGRLETLGTCGKHYSANRKFVEAKTEQSITFAKLISVTF